MTAVSPTSQPEITDRAWPPRFWWLKRGLAAALIFAVLLGAVRLWWGWVARNRLQAELDAIIAAGGLVSVADLPAGDVLDSDNAAILWDQAIAAIDPNANTPAQSDLTYNSYPPWPAKWHRLLESGVAANQDPIALARQARNRTKCDWKIQFDRPIAATLPPGLSNIRNLANVVGDSAIHAHLHGNDFEAIERVSDVLALAADVSQQPFLVSHLVGIGVRALAMSRLMTIAPDLKITTDDQRRQLQALVRDLLDRSNDASPLVRALDCERLSAIDLMQHQARDAPLLRPMFELDLAGYLSQYPALLSAARQASHSDIVRVSATMPSRSLWLSGRFSPPFASASSTVRPSRVMSNSWWFPGNRLIETDLRVRLEMRLAAVMVAVQLYRAERGDWPASLEQLVPRYLPSVPQDPYSYTGRPVGYLIAAPIPPNTARRPLVYSVFKAGDIEVGNTLVPAEPQLDWSQASVQFRDLSRWYPALSTQPAETDEADPDQD